jgi:hypothetical protein
MINLTGSEWLCWEQAWYPHTYSPPRHHYASLQEWDWVINTDSDCFTGSVQPASHPRANAADWHVATGQPYPLSDQGERDGQCGDIWCICWSHWGLHPAEQGVFTQLTPWCKVVLQKLIVVQLVKKLFYFMEPSGPSSCMLCSQLSPMYPFTLCFTNKGTSSIEILQFDSNSAI